MAQPLPVSVCAISLLSFLILTGGRRAQSSQLVDHRCPFCFRHVYHLCLARTSLHLKVDLTNVTSAVSRLQLTRAITQLNIIEGYGPRFTAILPSSRSSTDGSEGGKCIANKLRRGLKTCGWPDPLARLPSIASSKDSDKETLFAAIPANIMCLGHVSIHVEIKGIQMWACNACSILVDNHGICFLKRILWEH